MPERNAARIGGAAAISGGILTLVGNVRHPREPGQLDDAESLLEVVAGSEAWAPIHVVILVGLVLLLGGFFGLTQSITGDAATTWARLGWGIAIMGSGLGVAFMLTEAVAMAGLAESWANSSGPQKDLALAAGSAIFQLSLSLSVGAPLLFFGAAPMLCGVAILKSSDYPNWLGTVGVVFGSVTALASLIQLFTGVTAVTGLVLVPIGIVGVTLWIIYLGWLMWKLSAVVPLSGSGTWRGRGDQKADTIAN